MAFIMPRELETYLYKENIETINRGDETILTAAIGTALQEAYGCLSVYDRKKVFETTRSQRNASLLIFIKDIVVWHFVSPCNAGTDLQLRQDRCGRVVVWLRQVQKSDIKPDLPTVDEDGDGKSDTAGEYIYGSNPKRNQYF